MIDIAIFDFTNEKSKEQKPKASVWFQTLTGLSIALFGAGVSYGLQSVFVKQLSLQPVPIMSMETLLFRSVFQVLVFFPTAMIRNVHIIPPPGEYFFATYILLNINFLSEYRWQVFQIGFWYIIATMGSFQAFTMLAPAAALGARCSARTFFSVLLSMFWLKEKILKLEWISDRILS